MAWTSLKDKKRTPAGQNGWKLLKGSRIRAAKDFKEFNEFIDEGNRRVTANISIQKGTEGFLFIVTDTGKAVILFGVKDQLNAASAPEDFNMALTRPRYSFFLTFDQAIERLEFYLKDTPG